MAILFDLHSGWLLVILSYTDPVVVPLYEAPTAPTTGSSRLQSKWPNNSQDKSDLIKPRDKEVAGGVGPTATGQSILQ
jgi:hypothetical protein